MTLGHDRTGTGEPLVLIHGVGSRRAAWAPVMDLITPEREVLAVDLPGFGASPPDGTLPSVEGLAGRMERFFSEAGLERPHVAGNSLGGAVALELGRRGSVRSVAAFSPVGFWKAPGRAWGRVSLTLGRIAGERLPVPSSPRVQAALARPAMFIFAFGKPWKVSDEEILDVQRSGVEAPNFEEGVRLGTRHDFSDPGQLPEIPVTFAWGTRDVLLTYATQSRRARRLAPWARHVSLPGCGHVPFHDDPKRCAEVLLEASGG